MVGVKWAVFLGLAAFGLLWVAQGTVASAQGPRRTADVRSAMERPLAPPPDIAAPPARPASGSMLIPEKSLAKIFERGGLLMWPLLFCSVVMMVFVFERAICLRRGNILPRPFVTR